MDLLQEFDKKDITYLVIVSPEYYFKTNSEILRIFCNTSHMFGIYVTLGKPYDVLMRQFYAEGIDVSKLFFIDAVSKKEEKPNNAIFVNGPSSLTELSISISQVIQMAPKENTFLFFDSISTLLLYNNADIIIKFIHFLTAKLSEWKLAGIFISLDIGEDKRVIIQISQFCGKMIKSI